jgi:F-type H+-transporting ATPase subunit b
MQEQQQLENPPVVAEQPGSTPASPGVTDSTVEGGTSNPVVLDAVGEGTPEATTESVEHAVEGEHHEAFLGLDSYGWVAAAFVIFVLLLLYLKVPRAIAGALDGRAARIRGELDEARRLREDAERLLADYQSKQAQAAKDAEAILGAARTEAANIVADAQRQAEASVARRTRMAEDKIAAAERAAEADLRARAATLATEAAKRIIAGQSDAATQAKLTDQAIADLDARLH